MPKVITRNYSTYYDITTSVQFQPALDYKTGCYIGVATVDKKTAASFASREGFEALTDAQYLEITSVPEVEEPEPAASETGDPITDAAYDAATPDGPPAPPSS